MHSQNFNSIELRSRWNALAAYLLLLAGTATCWVLYQRFLVPVLEGPQNVSQLPANPPQLDLIISSFNRQELGSLLPVDAWERDQSKLVVSDQGIIMFREFVQVQDGYLEVVPFTMVIKGKSNTADDPSAEKETLAAPLILRCLKGARLKFQGENADPFSGKATLESARLVGQVDIYRPPSSDTADDAIEVATSNVHINDLQVYTMEEVQFAFGPHRGVGRQLLIDLQASRNSKPRQPLGLNDVEGIRRLELASLTQLELVRQHDEKLVIDLPQMTAPSDVVQVSPDSAAVPQNLHQKVRVTCQGPFVLDFDRRTAAFTDQVLVQADGDAPDQLSCHQLTILFESLRNGDSPWESLPTRESGSRPLQSPPAVASAEGRWDMRRFVAEGSPAVLTSHQFTARISSNLLSYDLLKEEVFARSQPTSAAANGADDGGVVTIVTPDFQLKATQIAYRMAPEGRLGQIIALGSGSLLKLASDDQREFFLQWMEMLSLEPDGDQHLITIKNGCKMRFDDDNHFQADHLRLWLEETSDDSRQSISNSTPQRSYQPNRLVAVNHVRINTPSLHGTTNQLTAFWRPSPTPLQPNRQLGRKNQMSTNIDFHFSQADTVGAASANAYAHLNRLHYAKAISPEFDDSISQYQWKVLPTPTNSTKSNPTEISTPLVYQGHFQLANHSISGNQQRDMAQHSVALVSHQEPIPSNLSGLSPPTGSKPPDRRFVFSGDEVELQLLFDGSVNQLDSMAILGNVQLFQEQARTKSERSSNQVDGLVIQAHFLQAFPQPDQKYRMLIIGDDNQSAIARTDQLSLSGNNIQLDQTANKLWIEGPGEAIITIDASSQSSLAAAPPRLAANPEAGPTDPTGLQQSATDYQDLNIHWSSGMVFDGRKAYFEDNVRLLAKGKNAQQQKLRTTASGQGLSIEFTQAISFIRDQNRRHTNSEIKEIIIVDRVTDNQRVFGFDADRNSTATSSLSAVELASIRHQIYDANDKLIDNQSFHATQVTIKLTNGLVNAKGPGWMTQQRVEVAAGAAEPSQRIGQQTSSANSNGMTANLNRNQNQNKSFLNQARSTGEISVVRVNFDGSVTASTIEKRFDVEGRVRTLYTSVDTFETKLDPDEKLSLPATAVTIKSDRLNYAQWQPRNSIESMHELQASGNVHVISGTFEATADRLSYQQQTEMLIIEGSPRSDAQLWHQTSPTARDRRHLRAEKILYRVTDGQTTIPNIKNIDIID